MKPLPATPKQPPEANKLANDPANTLGAPEADKLTNDPTNTNGTQKPSRIRPQQVRALRGGSKSSSGSSRAAE